MVIIYYLKLLQALIITTMNYDETTESDRFWKEYEHFCNRNAIALAPKRSLTKARPYWIRLFFNFLQNAF